MTFPRGSDRQDPDRAFFWCMGAEIKGARDRCRGPLGGGLRAKIRTQL